MKGKNKMANNVYTFTYNDLKRYLKNNFTDQLKNNILSRKFYKTHVNIKITK